MGESTTGVARGLDKVRALLHELKQDDYVRFRYGKEIEGGLKALDAHVDVDTREVEARLAELLELVRKGGAPAAPGPKSRRRTPHREVVDVGA